MPAFLRPLAARAASIGRAFRRAVATWRATAWRPDAIWRAAVAEDSMRPAIEPGDWLLLDPTPVTWPRRGAVVVVWEPGGDVLAIKRIAARPGDRVHIREGWLHLAADEAWLLGDNADVSVDSRRYGPVTFDSFVGRAWFRYWPPRRIGRIGGMRGLPPVRG